MQAHHNRRETQAKLSQHMGGTDWADASRLSSRLRVLTTVSWVRSWRPLPTFLSHGGLTGVLAYTCLIARPDSAIVVGGFIIEVCSCEAGCTFFYDVEGEVTKLNGVAYASGDRSQYFRVLTNWIIGTIVSEGNHSVEANLDHR